MVMEERSVKDERRDEIRFSSSLYPNLNNYKGKKEIKIMMKKKKKNLIPKKYKCLKFTNPSDPNEEGARRNCKKFGYH